jgi:hypothetical protein
MTVVIKEAPATAAVLDLCANRSGGTGAGDDRKVRPAVRRDRAPEVLRNIGRREEPVY